MSEYKRLTERYVDEIEIKACMTCETPTCDGCGIKKEILNRLADLETKIEAGKLVEPPCKIGDKVYQTDGIRVYDCVVKNIIFDTSGVAFDNSAIGKDIFLTREAAEARLKELEEKEE